MYKFEYQLKLDNFKELNEYLATHDRSVQKKLLKLMAGIIVIILISSMIILGVNVGALMLTLVGFIITMIVMPKIYWKIILAKADKTVEGSNLIFNKTSVIFDKAIIIQDSINQYEVQYSEITFIDFTMNNCLIFYVHKGLNHKLILPISVIAEDIEGFCTFLQKERNNEQE